MTRMVSHVDLPWQAAFADEHDAPPAFPAFGFFGRMTSFFDDSSVLALRKGAPIVFGVARSGPGASNRIMTERCAIDDLDTMSYGKRQ